VDVKANRENMDAMLKISGGVRKVPVILKAGKAAIGYGGS
jgi:hypothetical protein